MQVMLLSLQAAYAQKMCSIDGVTCQRIKTMEKDETKVTKLWLKLIWLDRKEKDSIKK